MSYFIYELSTGNFAEIFRVRRRAKRIFEEYIKYFAENESVARRT